MEVCSRQMPPMTDARRDRFRGYFRRACVDVARRFMTQPGRRVCIAPFQIMLIRLGGEERSLLRTFRDVAFTARQIRKRFRSSLSALFPSTKHDAAAVRRPPELIHRSVALPRQSAPAPWIDELVGTVATYVAVGFKIVVTFISQIATSPDVSRQRMSLLPSPLKSPVPTIDQAVDTVATYVAVGFKIVVPFISQIATSPAVSRQRMSVLPSPLKSPVPTIVQVLGDTVPTYEVVGFKIVVPFISQIATSPDVSRHRMSPMPVPLKSPVPTIDQAVDTVATYVAVGFRIVVPFISQIATSPLVSRQAMSLMPSSLKSCVFVGVALTKTHAAPMPPTQTSEGHDGLS